VRIWQKPGRDARFSNGEGLISEPPNELAEYGTHRPQLCLGVWVVTLWKSIQNLNQL